MSGGVVCHWLTSDAQLTILHASDRSSNRAQRRADGALADAAWNALKARTPRLFDGPIWACLPMTMSGQLCVTRSTYRQRIVQGAEVGGQRVSDLGVRQLGIKALVLGRDSAGAQHALLLRRSSEVAAYPNLWEVGPGGGVEVSEALPNLDLLRTCLLREAQEEIGLDLGAASALPQPICIVEDGLAMSTDVIFACRLHEPINPRAGWCHVGRASEHGEDDHDRWEYQDAAWVSSADLAAFVTSARHISPLTRVLLGAGLPRSMAE